jgi:hypothetical protein
MSNCRFTVQASHGYAVRDQPSDNGIRRIDTDTDSDPDADKPSTLHELTMSGSVKSHAISGSAEKENKFRIR